MQTELRPNPDALLAEMQKEEAAGRFGKLFIFLGMCPGVGKTHAMLEAAQRRQREGVNVLAGVIETHGRAETAALLEGLPVLARKQISHRGHLLTEFDLDEVLKQHPELVLVDELAHANAPGSRHAKRHQDVTEILRAGIDVYTTLNVQHIDSQVDTVRQITGVTITETVPDSVLDQAHEIQLIDLAVPKLLERLAEGKVYQGERAAKAADHFFKETNLTALREMALRFTAERVDRDLEDMRRLRRVASPWKTSARLLVGVGPSPYAESLIRWTRRAASRLACPWIVVWVESSQPLSSAEQSRLADTLALARRLGAEVISVTGENIARALLNVARERNVSQIVVGKPAKKSWFSTTLADDLIKDSGDIDVCLVRPLLSKKPESQAGSILRTEPDNRLTEYSAAMVLTFVLISIAWALLPYTGYVFAGLVFLLAVILAALRLSRGPVLLMATLSALGWDYFFIEPKFTLHINKLQDVIMFVMFFIVALSMGHLTSRLRQRELAERKRQQETAALLRVTQSAALSADADKGLWDALAVINELLHAETAMVIRGKDHTLPQAVHSASSFAPRPKEWGVIHWAFQHKLAAGRHTDTLPQSAATWFPLQTATSLMGVFGVKLPEGQVMDFGTRQTIEAFGLQLALVLEKEHFIEAVKHADLLAQSEHLQRSLLDSVSHELKTPLAVIQASLEALTELKNPYVEEINTASLRLQRVVNHLLQMTRIESAAIQPKLEWCLAGDVISQACDIVGESLAKHPLTITVPPELPAMKLDSMLLAQALANVLHNATAYTPEGTPLEITASLTTSKELRVIISDQGPGLPNGSEEQVFDKFFRAPQTPAGGTGLGLSISRAFMRAMGGEVTARNRPEGGVSFAFTLPVEILPA